MQKLGWGHFSTVWLARDFKYGTYVAIKVQKSASHYLDAAYDEVELLQKAAKLSTSDEWRERLKTIHGKDNPRQYTRDDCHVVQLLNAFIYRGPYGHHFCMIFEILGVNLLEIIKRYQYKGVPINLARKIARQCLIGLDYLHTICHIIHTDLKPENVLLTLTQEQINQIVESGEIKRDPRLEDKIAQLQSIFKILPMRTIIEECKGTWGEESPRMASSSAKKSNHSPPKVTPTNSNFIEDTIGSLSTTVDGVFDLKEKFEEIVETHGETLNQRDKKNLKKKLKRKLKKNKKAQGEGEQEESDDEKENHVNAPAPTSSVAQTKKENIKTEAPKKEAPKPKGLLEIIPDPFENDPDPYVREFKLKIADLGNACWTHHHFQPEIQTRQYRSPEVILGIYFNETADIWSFACMNYEMLTGDFLFAPQKNKDYSKSDDHLALMMELLQKFPRNYATIGTNSKKYFDKFGNLKKINDLRHFPLKEALLKTYHFKPEEADLLSSFMMPMLSIFPEKRAKAFDMLSHPWITGQSRNKDHIAPEEVRQANLDNFHNYLKNKCVFYRELKDFGDTQYDGDCGEAPAENEEYLDPDVGFRRLSSDLERTLPEKKDKYIEKDFAQTHVGYDDGIDVNGLDSTGNWQFGL